jgi:hypothetical protein
MAIASVTEEAARPAPRSPSKPGLWVRLAEAFRLAQMRRAEREIEAFLERHDDLLICERQRLVLGIGSPTRR